MALSILRPLMYFLISMISTPKKVWFHLSQWFQRENKKKKKKIYELMKFLIQTQPPYNLYQKFLWDTKNNENEKERGLIVKVYRGQRMPSCSKTSHDHYYLHRSCVPEGGQIEEVMVFNAIFNYTSVISWLSCFIGGVYWENHRPAASLTNFIHNVSSNKGVLIAGIYNSPNLTSLFLNEQ
jgi:hypothetical protein